MIVHTDRRAANLETVKAVYVAFRDGDVDTVIAALSPDVEWTEPENPFKITRFQELFDTWAAAEAFRP